MELRQIRFAVAVADDLHFGRAAERMFIAQPALSQHVRRLEREIGVRLFDRGARHVRVTPAGEAFLEVGRRLLRQADEAVVSARRAEAGDTGSVSIGASLPLAAPVLSLLLRRLAAVRPDVRPALVAGRALELVDRVRRHELDVALVEEAPSDARLHSVPLMGDPLVVLLPAQHALAQDEALCAADLAKAGLIAVSRSAAPVLHDRVVALCVAADLAPHVVLEADDPELAVVAVAAGLGVSVVPRSLAMARGVAGTAWRPLDDDGTLLIVSAVAASEGATPQARLLLDLAGRLLDSHGPSSLPGRHLELALGPVERTA